MTNHIRAEIRTKLFREAAVRNFEQWAKAWFSNIKWVIDSCLVLKLCVQKKTVIYLEKSWLISCQQPRWYEKDWCYSELLGVKGVYAVKK